MLPRSNIFVSGTLEAVFDQKLYILFLGPFTLQITLKPLYHDLGFVNLPKARVQHQLSLHLVSHDNDFYSYQQHGMMRSNV
jgi:hypothetical protein